MVELWCGDELAKCNAILLRIALVSEGKIFVYTLALDTKNTVGARGHWL